MAAPALTSYFFALLPPLDFPPGLPSTPLPRHRSFFFRAFPCMEVANDDAGYLGRNGHGRLLYRVAGEWFMDSGEEGGWELVLELKAEIRCTT